MMRIAVDAFGGDNAPLEILRVPQWQKKNMAWI